MKRAGKRVIGHNWKSEIKKQAWKDQFSEVNCWNRCSKQSAIALKEGLRSPLCISGCSFSNPTVNGFQLIWPGKLDVRAAQSSATHRVPPREIWTERTVKKTERRQNKQAEMFEQGSVRVQESDYLGYLLYSDLLLQWLWRWILTCWVEIIYSF